MDLEWANFENLEFTFSENNYSISDRPNHVNMLEELFPGLRGGDGGIPEWKEEGAPWTILGYGPSGLISMMKEMFSESKDGIFIHPSASIGDYVEIQGPCFIGENAEIRHSAFLRKGSWISKNAVVGHATEVKNSILLPHSKAPHFNYVGDSILGFGVNLGAGSKISNVRNDRRRVFLTMKDGSRIDSGLNKLGAMIGDDSQLGCNVVTNPGSIITPKSMINPNETVSGWN